MRRRDGRQECLHRHGRGRPGARRRQASCARPTAWAGRNARPCRGCTCTSEVADALLAKLAAADATRSASAIPPGASTGSGRSPPQSAYDNYARYIARLRSGGGTPRRAVASSSKAALWHRGFFVRPTIAEAPLDHPLWNEEMFLPILMVHRVASNEEAMALANRSPLGLTAGFYGSAAEIALVQRAHRGRRHVRESSAGRHHRRLARLPGIRRLERLGQHRQGHRLLLLSAAIPARAVPDRGRVMSCRC